MSIPKFDDLDPWQKMLVERLLQSPGQPVTAITPRTFPYSDTRQFYDHVRALSEKLAADE